MISRRPRTMLMGKLSIYGFPSGMKESILFLPYLASLVNGGVIWHIGNCGQFLRTVKGESSTKNTTFYFLH